jgi:lipopolysaccharide transport system ATP-binding protein
MPNISINNLSIQFPIYSSVTRSVRNSVLKAATGGRFTGASGAQLMVTAIDSINLDIRAGERVGLMGHNGSGKTTFLRSLAGGYPPTNGSVRIEGSISSFLDISLGMETEASGYENIYLRGLLMGMQREEIDAKLETIAELTGLGQYLDMPLRTYSSGMLARLAFAVSVNADADILLMDEWLSVGDADFATKSSAILSQKIENTSILVIASHSLDLIKKVCTRKIVFSQGKVTEDSAI